MSRVLIVGAGLAGLSAACHLTGRGHQVIVLDRGDRPGGRAGVLERDGFRFDTGPSVLTMPDLISDALAAVGVRMPEVLPLQRLDPAYRGVFADADPIHVRFGHEAMREEIRQTCGSVDAAAFDDFVVWLRRLYRLEMPHFIDRNFDSALGLLSAPVAAARLLGMGAFGRLGPAVRRRFRDPRLHRLFSFQALYAGLAPESALALYAVITYMDCIEGVWNSPSGMSAVPKVLAEACIGAGAQIRHHSTVIAIRADPGSGRVTGVELADGERLDADAVVCTVDLPVAYDQLLPGLTRPKSLRRARYSPSAVVWHVGVNGTPGPEVAQHNIHFGRAWNSSFDDLLHRGALMADPSRLVTVASLGDPGAAPAGSSTLFVLEPAPNLAGQVDWKREAGPMRDRLLAFLAGAGYPSEVVTEELVTPLDWARQGMAAGTPFSLAHTFAQTGPFRPANVDRRRPGLVFAGSGTVPGVGVPMVLISGKLAAQRVEQVLAGAR